MPYRWVLLGTLGFTELVSFGVLQFAFSALLVPMEAELGWSRAALTGGYSLGLVAAGVMAIPVGLWIDRHGPRTVMTLGSALATLLVLAWSGANSVAVYYGVWAGLGVCMAAVLYEPAFAVVARWFHEDRGRALGWLTMIAALSSTVFVPATARLAEVAGWRGALRILAAVLFLATVLPHALVLRPNPPVAGALRRRRWASDLSAVMRSAAFRHTGLAFALSAFATIGLYVHFLPLALERGLSVPAAAAALGLVGVMKLPGRAMFTILVRRFDPARLAAALLIAQVAGLGALLALPGAAGIWACALVFGAGDGGLTPARAAVLGDRFDLRSYGAVLGAMGLVLALSRAAAPIGLSVLEEGLGYAGAIFVLCAGLGASVVAMCRGAAMSRGSGARRAEWGSGAPAPPDASVSAWLAAGGEATRECGGPASFRAPARLRCERAVELENGGRDDGRTTPGHDRGAGAGETDSGGSAGPRGERVGGVLRARRAGGLLRAGGQGSLLRGRRRFVLRVPVRAPAAAHGSSGSGVAARPVGIGD